MGRDSCGGMSIQKVRLEWLEESGACTRDLQGLGHEICRFGGNCKEGTFSALIGLSFPCLWVLDWNAATLIRIKKRVRIVDLVFILSIVNYLLPLNLPSNSKA